MRISDEVGPRLAARIAAGERFGEACAAVGVNEQTASRWRRRGRGETGTMYARFARSVDEASAVSDPARLTEGQLIAVVERAAALGRQASGAQWLLERQWPERWGSVRERNREKEAPDEPVDPFAALDEFAGRAMPRSGT